MDDLATLPRIAPDSQRSALLSAIPWIALLDVIVVRRAWVMDDAYITFRTVDNVIHGHGLRWNTTERVQAYTHPLWMLLMSACSLFTREVFYTSYFLELVLTTLTAYVVLVKLARTFEQRFLCAAVLCLSKAFVDYSTSGLENSLSHLLIALFALSFLREASPQRALREQLLIASFALMTRLDLAVILAPPLVATFASTRFDRAERLRRTLLSTAWGLSPILAWEAFSLFYYGSLIPNSARAKLFSGLPTVELVKRSFFYFTNSLRMDPETLLVIVCAAACAFVSKQRRLAYLAMGIVLSLGYVTWVGGCHMSGRFFSVPLLLGTALLARLPVSPQTSAGIAVVCFMGAWVQNFPTFTRAYQSEEPDNDGNGITDYARGVAIAGLITRAYWEYGPRHEWVDAGRELRKHPEQVPIWGGVGLAGYYAGPAAQIIDKYALTDPLLARLPIPDAAHQWNFRIGHYERRLPEGYVESLSKGDNEVRHPSLHRYYEKLRVVTRDPLFSPSRWWAVLLLNVGAYDGLLRDYLADYNMKRVDAVELPPSRDVAADGQYDAEEHYDWSTQSVRHGVAFSEWGVRVGLGALTRLATIELGGSPGEYQVVFRHLPDAGTATLCRMPANRTVRVPVPSAAAQESFDAVEVLPLGGQGIRRITHFAIVSPAPPGGLPLSDSSGG